MHDHFHLLLTLGSEITIEQTVQLVKGGFAQRARDQLQMNIVFWRKGFSEVRILDAEAYGRVREYIWNNPVRRGLVLEGREYAYSSAHPGFELDPATRGLRSREFRGRLER